MKPNQRGLYTFASSLQSEVGNSRITISGEAEVVIQNGGQEPRRGRRVLTFRYTGLE